MALFMVTGFQVSNAAEQLIKEFVDLIQERGTAEWVDAYGRPVGLEGPDSDRNILQMRPIYDPEAAARGDEPSLGLYMEAKPAPGDMEFGLEGQFTVQLPAQRFYQFQGFAHVQNGEARETNVKVLVQTRPDLLSDWTTAQIFTGEKLGTTAINDELKEDILAFVLDLSDWAGDEVRIVLAMNVVPAYSKVGAEESWSPNVISAQWTSARIVGSAFRVILGEPEKVGDLSSESSKASALQGAQAQVQSVTAYPTDSEILILNGETDADGGDWHMTNPGESGVNTTYIPASGGVPGHFVAYQTTRLAPSTINGASAYPRVIDFRNIPTKNMSNASRDEIVSASYIDPANGAARTVIEPGTPYSDDWPGHVAIASVYASAYSGWPYTPILNAFVHTEDKSQNDMTPNIYDSVYLRIGYARSTSGTSDFGRSFQKLNHTSGNPIITYSVAEEEILMSTGQYGVGGPSIIATDDYYYMLYYTQALIIYSATYTAPDGYYHTRAGISIARATRSIVDSQYYSANNNPWVKYRQIVAATTDIQNWSQPGLGGDESILWNYKRDNNGFMGEEVDRARLWRAFPKISYNSFLDKSYPHQVVLVCKGGIDPNYDKPAAIVIHTSANLIEWSDFIVVKMDGDDAGGGNHYTYEYPTIIGLDPLEGGYSGHTTENNLLYYQKDKRNINNNLLDADIFRVPIRFATQ